MARYSLLPGMGDRVDISLALVSGAAAAATDEFDCSRCAQLAIQVKTWAAGDLGIQVQQSFDGTHFSAVGSEQTSQVAGDVIRIPITSGPFGIIRLSLRSSDTSATGVFTLIGYPAQWSN